MAKKRKKKILRRINPEKSNKMIYAVGGGLAVVMILILMAMLRSGDMPEDPAGVMKSTLAYVEKTDGVLDVLTDAATARVTIVYEPSDKVDMTRVAQYAGVRLSHRLTGREVEIRLSRYRPENVEYRFWVLDGRVIRHAVGGGEPGTPPPEPSK